MNLTRPPRLSGRAADWPAVDSPGPTGGQLWGWRRRNERRISCAPGPSPAVYYVGLRRRVRFLGRLPHQAGKLRQLLIILWPRSDAPRARIAGRQDVAAVLGPVTLPSSRLAIWQPILTGQTARITKRLPDDGTENDGRSWRRRWTSIAVKVCAPPCSQGFSS